MESISTLPELFKLVDENIKIDPAFAPPYLLKGRIDVEVPGFLGGDDFRMGESFTLALKYNSNDLNVLVDAAEGFIKRNWDVNKKTKEKKKKIVNKAEEEKKESIDAANKKKTDYIKFRNSLGTGIGLTSAGLLCAIIGSIPLAVGLSMNNLVDMSTAGSFFTDGTNAAIGVGAAFLGAGSLMLIVGIIMYPVAAHFYKKWKASLTSNINIKPLLEYKNNIYTLGFAIKI